MTSESTTAGSEPTREQVDQMKGAVVLEFGAGWCGYCQELQPAVDELRAQHSGVRYVWVEDGRGKPLGRSFRVKLWPTLVFMRDGQVLNQVSRPSREEVADGFRQLSASE